MERRLPTYDELPSYHGESGCAWDVWGRGDELGTINLLTDDVVQRAANEEIRTGRRITIDLPLNFMSRPFFSRRSPHVTSWVKPSDRRDEEIHFNTQSGSQWDGLLHFPTKEKLLYQGHHANSLPVGPLAEQDPGNIDREIIKLGIHNWADHGISGRGVLLDMLRFYTARDGAVPYDPFQFYAIPRADLEACAAAQRVTFRTGDILFVHVGFLKKFRAVSVAEREHEATKDVSIAGLEASDDMRRFLWDNHFSAAASDNPSLEAFGPVPSERTLHETMLPFWGMPIGELFDLDKLSDVCAELQRYTFFVSSWPLNVLGGVASPPNAAAIF